MSDASDPLAAEREFFTALVEARPEALGRLLADDFTLVDVLSGSEVSRASLLEALGSGQVRFEAIEPAEQRVRTYGATAVVTGRTRMSVRIAGAAFVAHSRYTHVYVEQQGRWRLVAAQGTPIAPGQGPEAA
jgi:ketosteroid isomerase-like protein